MLVRKDLLEKLIDMANVSVEYMNDRWITVHPQGHEKGQPLLVKDGESNKDAIDRKFGNGELTKSQIEKKIEDIYAEKRKIVEKVKDYNWKTHPEIKKKLDEKDSEIQKLISLKDKAKNDIKTESVLNLSLKLVEQGTSLMPKTRTITTKIKNPNKARLKDYKSSFKKQALKENPNFRFHSFDNPDFRDERI